MPLITLILLPFIGSLLAAVLPSNARNTESTLAGLIAVFCTVQAALYFPEIADGGVIRQELTWLPALGLNLVIRMDGFRVGELKGDTPWGQPLKTLPGPRCWLCHAAKNKPAGAGLLLVKRAYWVGLLELEISVRVEPVEALRSASTGSA